MERTKIFNLFQTGQPSRSILLKGWVKTRRGSKSVVFLELNDGTSLKNIQVVVDQDVDNYDQIAKLTTGSSVSVTGRVVESPGTGQDWEIHATKIEIINRAPESYPLQKKRHGDEFLRTIAHLRPRTNKYGAMFRIRSKAAFAVHEFFQSRGFTLVHTPILTGQDCEGAGELFQVTSLDLNNPPKIDGKPDLSKDFFGKKAYLTVSGQLSAEMLALSLGDVYTFGPTFRAENSNTSRHVAEFWMIEPEMAFYDIEDDMVLAEAFIKYLIQYILDHCSTDIALFAKYVDPELMRTLDHILKKDFIRIPYGEAIEILSTAKIDFEYPIAFGTDLQSEHERYLTEHHFKQTVIVKDYPKTIKPFYMRLNDDHQTVAAMDVLVPRIGEIIGGSQREERLDLLEARMNEFNLSKEAYWWYIDSRQYGSVPHSGFGMGFERFLMLVSGVTNIRDVIPFPRTPQNLDF